MSKRNFFVFSLLLIVSTSLSSAAPTLRLVGSDLRPVWIQQGTNGPTNVSFEIQNIGDGTLNPQVRGSHPWLAPAVDPSRPCSSDATKTCQAIRVLFNSNSLTPGTYRGVVTVTDANAVDAPQSVAVLAYVNGNVPSRLDFYLPPTGGANDSVTFQTPSGPPPSLRPTTQTGGTWLAVSTSGMGSFQFLYTHKIQAKVQTGMAAGDYNGSIAISNSSFASDNKSVPATLHVTAQPIAKPATLWTSLTGIQGGAAAEQALAVANGGQGTLTISGATPSGGAWLTATVDGTTVKLKADPTSLSPGFYDGSISIASNAANNPVTVAVQFEVQAASAPIAGFRGVVDAASFNSPVGPGALVSLFGSQLATGVSLASAIPLPTMLADTSVFVNNVAAPLLFVSSGQINFQMPFEASGTVQVRAERQGQRGNTVSVQVARRGPGLFGFPGTTYGIVQNASRGNAFAWPDLPVFAGIPKAAARPGDVLVLYGSGLGPVNPAVATGAAAGANPPSQTVDTPRVAFSRGFLGPFADPQFVGLTPGFVGLYQVNVQVPSEAPANPRTPVRLDFPDGTFSNVVEIAVER